jgi:hypothetical protein
MRNLRARTGAASRLDGVVLAVELGEEAVDVAVDEGAL